MIWKEYNMDEYIDFSDMHYCDLHQCWFRVKVWFECPMCALIQKISRFENQRDKTYVEKEILVTREVKK